MYEYASLPNYWVQLRPCNLDITICRASRVPCVSRIWREVSADGIGSGQMVWLVAYSFPNTNFADLTFQSSSAIVTVRIVKMCFLETKNNYYKILLINNITQIVYNQKVLFLPRLRESPPPRTNSIRPNGKKCKYNNFQHVNSCNFKQ